MTTTTPAASKQVTFLLDGIPFTGRLLKTYTRADDDIVLAVAVEYYELNGKRYTAESDDSAVHVSADYLV